MIKCPNLFRNIPFSEIFCRCLAVATLFNFFVSNINAQSNIDEIDELTQCVSEDVAATIHIPDLDGLIDAIESHKIFQSHDFLDSIALIARHDPSFIEQWELLVDELRKVNGVHIIVWKQKPKATEEKHQFALPWQNENNDVAILFKINQSEKLIARLSFFNRAFTSSNAKPETGDDVDSGRHNMSFSNGLTDRWLVVCNSNKRVKQLVTGLKSTSPINSSLSDDRRFKTAFAEFKNSSNALIFTFARPEYFPSFFTDSRGNTERAKLENLEEIPACAMTIRFQPDSGNIIINSATSNTQPAIGIASKWNAMRSIPTPFPEFCFRVRSIEFEAWDPEKRLQAAIANHDRVHGEGSYMAGRKKQYGDDCEQFMKDWFNAISYQYFVRHETEAGLYESIAIYKVNDYEAAKRYLTYWIDQAKNDPDKEKERLTILPESAPNAIAFGMSPETFKVKQQQWVTQLKSRPGQLESAERNYWRAIEKTGKPVEELADVIVENDGLVLTKDWLIGGSIRDVYRLIDFMNGEVDDAKNELAPFYKRIDQSKNQNDFGNPGWIRAGDNYVDEFAGVFARMLVSKYGNKNTKITTDVFKGRSFEQLKAGKEFNGDLFDITSYLVTKAYIDCCEDIVIMRRKNEQGGNLLCLMAVIFKQGAKTEN